MSISNPFSATKVDDIDTVNATEANSIGVALTKAVDGVGGGTYSPSSVIDIGGSGLRLTGTGKLQYASRSITRVQNSVPINVNTGLPGFDITTVAVGDSWRQEVLVPHGATVTAVTAYIDPANDALPTTNAQIEFVKVNVVTHTSTQISLTTDPNTGASYQALHGFGPTGLSEVIDRTVNRYYVRMVPEAGGDTDDYLWRGVTVTYTITSQDDGY